METIRGPKQGKQETSKPGDTNEGWGRTHDRKNKSTWTEKVTGLKCKQKHKKTKTGKTQSTWERLGNNSTKSRS